MNEFIVQHDIHPVIDQEFDFEEGPGAIFGIAAGKHFGKIVINLDR
jgi:NADPH:quinone reductase-like Zn-dependent oxidoreductase